MRKKIRTILFIAMLVLLTAGLCACGGREDTVYEEYGKQGYKIFVTYNSNGGSLISAGTNIIDAFKPENYEKDADGNIHIRLMEPTDSRRPSSSGDKITMTRDRHFYAGWYQTRTPVTNALGNIVDENGKEMKEVNGTFYYLKPGSSTELQTTTDVNGKEVFLEGTPVFTYADKWDFENDEIVYKEGDPVVNITLYAGWVKYFEFDYLYEADVLDKDGKPTGEKEWKSFGSTNFDYKTTKATNNGRDGIWLPRWTEESAEIVRTHPYASGENYEFPALSGKTFLAAYSDEACQNEIITTDTNPFKHQGTLDEETGTAQGRVQNIYVKFMEGTQYRVRTAKQLSELGNPAGYYEIYNDLDFTGLSWNTGLSSNQFTGKFYGKDGKTVTISNATVTYNRMITGKDPETMICGLFGEVLDGAEIKNVNFVNATVDVKRASSSGTGWFGLLAGYVNDGATIENVSVSGTLKLYEVSLANTPNINVIAGENRGGITVGDVKLIVYGEYLEEEKKYVYYIDPTSVNISADGQVEATYLISTQKLDKEQFEFQFNGGQI